MTPKEEIQDIGAEAFRALMRWEEIQAIDPDVRDDLRSLLCHVAELGAHLGVRVAHERHAAASVSSLEDFGVGDEPPQRYNLKDQFSNY